MCLDSKEFSYLIFLARHNLVLEEGKGSQTEKKQICLTYFKMVQKQVWSRKKSIELEVKISCFCLPLPLADCVTLNESLHFSVTSVLRTGSTICPLELRESSNGGNQWERSVEQGSLCNSNNAFLFGRTLLQCWIHLLYWIQVTDQLISNKIMEATVLDWTPALAPPHTHTHQPKPKWSHSY
jgi:hypothetical protein